MSEKILKTFSFLDFGSKDLLKKKHGQIVKIKAEDHHHAFDIFIDQGVCDECINWTNTGTKAWCWEEME